MKAFGRRVLSEGLLAGCIGYAVVLLFFVLLNMAAGRPPLSTAEMLGRALFFGGVNADVGVGGAVLAFNGFHLAVFLSLGLLAAWLVARAEEGPQFWYLAFTALLFVVLHMLGLLVAAARALPGALTPAAVLIASGLAGAAMIYYLWRAHPRLRAEVRTYNDQPI